MTDPHSGTAESIRIRSAVPTFLVENVGATARWYVSELGFAIAGTFGQEPYAYASLQWGGAEIMLLSCRDYQKPDLGDLRPEGRWDAYIRMDGVRALYERVRSGPSIQSPLTHRPYGDWEFEVRDPNGYVLVFGGGE
jgi:uncharacterized glyoxalase superfamily protein PhnB